MRWIRSCGLLLAVCIAGCGGGGGLEVTSDETNDPSDEQKSNGTVAYSAMTLKNPFFKVISNSIKAEAEKNGFEYVEDDGNDSVKTQTDQIDHYIAQGYSAIILSPVEATSLGTSIKKANEAGIPVFTCDVQSKSEDGVVTAHVGTDNFSGGELAGQAMIDALGETGGKVLILSKPVANSCVLRVDGFKKVINSYNEERETGKIEIVAEQDGDGDTQKGNGATAAALQTDKDLAGIFAINDPSALGAYSALEAAGLTDQVTIIGFDGQLIGKQAIKEGKIFADPIQFPDKIGTEIMKRVVSHLNGEEVEAMTLIPTALYTKKDAMDDPELK